MKTVLTICTVIASIGYAGCSSGCRHDMEDVSHADIGSRVQIIGRLGMPVGQTVTVTGTKTEGKMHSVFHVASVEGVRRVLPTTISVEGISHWTNGTSATVLGREKASLHSGARIFGHGSHDRTYQGPGQYLLMSFEIVRIEEPKGLTTENN